MSEMENKTYEAPHNVFNRYLDGRNALRSNLLLETQLIELIASLPEETYLTDPRLSFQLGAGCAYDSAKEYRPISMDDTTAVIDAFDEEGLQAVYMHFYATKHFNGIHHVFEPEDREAFLWGYCAVRTAELDSLIFESVDAQIA